MKNLVSLLVLFCVFNSSYAQVKSIKQAKAYYYIRIPGHVPAEEKQNPIERKPDTVLNVYLEISGSLPTWKKAWQQGRSYSLAENTIKENNFVIGKKPDSEAKVVMKKAKTNQLIVLELVPSTPEAAPQKLSRKEILLQGVLNGKTFYYRVKKPVRIDSPEFM